MQGNRRGVMQVGKKIICGCCATLLAAAALGGCAPAGEAPERGPLKAGTVRHVDLEGGFYGIVADDGTQYEFEGVHEDFLRDGLRVRFRSIPCPECMSTRMWGQIVKITEIEKEPSK